MIPVPAVSGWTVNPNEGNPSGWVNVVDGMQIAMSSVGAISGLKPSGSVYYLPGSTTPVITSQLTVKKPDGTVLTLSASQTGQTSSTINGGLVNVRTMTWTYDYWPAGYVNFQFTQYGTYVCTFTLIVNGVTVKTVVANITIPNVIVYGATVSIGGPA
jgi:hypothetical protein